MGSVLAQVPPEDRPLVRAQAGRVRRLVARPPGIDRRLRRRACVQVAAIAPQLPADRLSLLVRHTLWSYWIDRRIEAPDTDPEAVERLGEAVAAVTTGDLAGGDPLLAELGHTVDGLWRHDPAGAAAAWFGVALQDTLAAEAEQLRLDRAVAAGVESPPTVEQYLLLAARNVNYRPFAYALLALTGCPLASAQLRCVDTALVHASYAVRLANDVHGVAQDRARSTLNALDLRTAAGAPVTLEYVWARADRELRAHDAALRALAGLGMVPAGAVAALVRSAEQVIRLYRRTDLR